MRDKDKTKEQLLNELVEMRQRISKLETAETQGKPAEEALQESERRYRLLAENITDVIWIMDTNLRYTYVSPSITRLRGYTVDEVMAGTAEDTLTPASLEIARKVLAEELAKERKGQKDLFRSWTLELEMNCKDGSTVWTEAKITGLREPGDLLPKLLGVTRDITDRKQAEEVVRQAEKRYKAMFDNRLQMVYINNEQGLFLDANDYALERLGYTRDDLRKVSFQDILHPEDLPKAVEGIADVLAKGFMDHSIELRVITKSGETIWVETFGIPLEWDVAHYIGMGIARDITDRKQAEEEVQRKEQYFRSLIENAADAIVILNGDGTIRYQSPSYERVLGYTPEEEIGKDMLDNIHPDDTADIADVFARLLEHPGEILSVEIRARHRDGSWHAFEATGNNLLHDPVVEGIVVNFRDITDRKQAEEALQRSEEQFRSIYEESPIGIAVFDCDGNLAHANKAYSDIFGVPHGVDVALGAYNLFEDPTVTDEVKGKLHRGETARYETQFDLETAKLYKRSRVVTLDLDVLITPLGLENGGAPSGYLLQLQDITDRKQAEEALRDSEARYRLLAENMADVISVTDMTGRPTYMSPSVRRLLGYSVEEAIAHSLEEGGLTPASREVARKALARQLAAENDGQTDPSKSRPIEMEFYRQDGSTVWVELTVSFLRDSNGQPIEILSVLRDITERKRFDEERERLLQELGEKTKELEQIVFVASHDLRSPLVNIQGFTRELQQSLEEVCSVLQREDVPPAVRETLAVPVNEDIPDAFRHIFASSAKIDSLISGLLRLSRLGRAALTMEKLDMDELMADVIRALEFFVKGAGATVQVEDLPPCRGDRTQINQVFSNLIDNALKFLDANRTGIIRVSGWSEDGQAVYCVEDNGIGVAPEHQERVFEIFQRLDPSANSGEGLGLAIVRRILERHAGKAWVESEPGKGSKFFVSLPTV
ncbi:MAG: PAS domain S-box protein [Dehalococcoidia bacterium]|nr:PAS domain S-box protein [Dehalococcoidia bacterium]